MTTLINLGWRNFFQAQLDDREAAELLPARVMAVHRDRVELCGPDVAEALPLAKQVSAADIAVGDWVLVDPATPRLDRVLERFSEFRRRAAGTQAATQLLAANVDTLFIVTSANRDFNIARLERYLALAHEAAAYPVVVISKVDTVSSVAEFVTAAQALSPGLLVEAVDARHADSVGVLLPWCDAGHTVAVLGSSGVGKSTLINTLTGQTQLTQSVREDDQRGRHTTTSRSMHPIAGGGWLIDTPGMRELQLVDAEDGLEAVFASVNHVSGIHPDLIGAGERNRTPDWLITKLGLILKCLIILD